MTQGGNYWTLFTPGIWKVLHAVLQLCQANLQFLCSLQLHKKYNLQVLPAFRYFYAPSKGQKISVLFP